MVEFPTLMNETLAQPTKSSPTRATPSAGASAVKRIAIPNPRQETIIGRSPVRPRAAVNSPPSTAPIPIEAVMKPKVSEPPWNVRVAKKGRLTLNS